ncbi:MAG TPA: ATP phosphoribosyltransferase regulatory subunit [Burkholderiaceae bacterium]|jgi:ATP phosphoribosyltransferase regulatory subunit|nr:ATP phosphoribosyltransferase regulatory subunit [Burkholderiaceae bacterium]
MARWLLPEGISDVLPAEARRVEELRRALLDLYASYGYQLVIPPLIEYLDSLLTGTGRDLDLRTFKLVDQLSGRQLGLRADITPQTARIDAHILNRSGVVRLCYAGSVLHTRPAHPLATRQPIQVGAELYGHEGPAADAEVQELAVASLRRAGVERVLLDLGHTGIVRALLADAPAAVAEDILEALAAKDMPTLREAAARAAPATAAAVLTLTRLHGDASVIDEARRELPATREIGRALDDLARLVEASRADAVSVDLADLHGYRYYTGVNFAAYAAQVSSALLRGGRYDDIGRAFGRARPATGFSIDLRDLARLNHAATPAAILAPADGDRELARVVDELRARGEVVVRQLTPGESAPEAVDRVLRRIDGRWQIVALD